MQPNAQPHEQMTVISLNASACKSLVTHTTSPLVLEEVKPVTGALLLTLDLYWWLFARVPGKSAGREVFG